MVKLGFEALVDTVDELFFHFELGFWNFGIKLVQTGEVDSVEIEVVGQSVVKAETFIQQLVVEIHFTLVNLMSQSVNVFNRNQAFHLRHNR